VRMTSLTLGSIVALLVLGVIASFINQQLLMPKAESLETLNAQLNGNPHDFFGFARRGRLKMANGRYHEAEIDLTRAIELSPHNNHDWYHWRAICYVRMNQQDRALADLDKAISLWPNDPLPYVDRGIVQERKGKLLEALEMFDTAILKLEQPNRFTSACPISRPDSYRCYINKAECLLRLKRFDAAVDPATKAIEYSDDYFDPYYLRGLAYFYSKNAGEALNDLNKALMLSPSNPKVLMARAQVHAAMRNYARAMSDMDEAVSLAPKNKMLKTTRAWIKKRQEESGQL
ncbi:MAG: tetratricopeptide repeat protein, partial [Cyanobacteria bacterium]|nr:tetratricopeptide repeat protein [Cyanobacteriota bacterium]